MEISTSNICAVKLGTSGPLGGSRTPSLEASTMDSYMESVSENCLHLAGLRLDVRSEFRCPACGRSLDLEGVERWVREAEEARDEAYSMVRGNGLAEILLQERQREVYRRRKVLYELRDVERRALARPEMIMVSYIAAENAYGCRIFHKEPRPAWEMEEIKVGADLASILALREYQSPNVRLASVKLEEFHTLRLKLLEQDTPPPLRRVFYQNEL